MKRQQMSQPISTRDQFSAGGSQIPIVTRNSTQSVAGVQQMGYSVGKTTLGPYRMGDADGNAPGSAIYPDDIFSPLPARGRKQTDVHFTSVGNRTFQPEDGDSKLHALLKKFGDQQFKAIESQPFEEYFRTQELARQTDAAARISSVEDQGITREIMRSLVDARRQSSEADFLRRMMAAGLSPEAAQMEIDNVNRASALQEARTVDDRPHQQKLLISRIAQARIDTTRGTASWPRRLAVPARRAPRRCSMRVCQPCGFSLVNLRSASSSWLSSSSCALTL
jgi:hypothetical protein